MSHNKIEEWKRDRREKNKELEGKARAFGIELISSIFNVGFLGIKDIVKQCNLFVPFIVVFLYGTDFFKLLTNK